MDQGVDAVDAFPVSGSAHQTFLDAARQRVAESVDLHLGLVADRDVVVAALPHRARPVVQAADLFGEIGERPRLHPVQGQLHETPTGASV
ncbi:MAG: hypothetical protein GY926_14970 [bacterium]|nr:hypothetical protein [bacterium]